MRWSDGKIERIGENYGNQRLGLRIDGFYPLLMVVDGTYGCRSIEGYTMLMVVDGTSWLSKV